ncbi:MAG TPA: tRNA pseudouridine(38-40) synthase TruA [Candidatus Cottocaccamicrobium excrementipullorum]|nr:tRNA pseudouridine(38-40) synthase TruA [Candidatus Cottocaccamicrobium excrementipullorum]
MEHSVNYLLRLQYDGSRYEGWQKQKNTDRTIQGKLESVLGQLAGCPVQVNGSGRTDAGVHALGQAASVCLPGDIPKEEILAYANRYLPEDIKVLSVSAVDQRFHARLWAKEKTYCYRIDTGSKKDVFERKYVYGFPFSLDIAAMEQAARFLEGTHDYKSFCGNKKMKKSTVRTVRSISLCQQEGKISLYFTGDGFLQHMVRIMTGTLIEVGLGKRSPESMKEILEAGDRRAAGFTAPPEGLFLVSVEY